jgi:hypothetical protein
MTGKYHCLQCAENKLIRPCVTWIMHGRPSIMLGCGRFRKIG